VDLTSSFCASGVEQRRCCSQSYVLGAWPLIVPSADGRPASQQRRAIIVSRGSGWPAATYASLLRCKLVTEELAAPVLLARHARGC
jgi:hypothetical protein